jgi:hypothetical protein
MSAPGIQLNPEPHLTYFQPTVRQYLQKIIEAVMSNNLPAARQAYAQLTKAVPSLSQGGSAPTNKLATRIGQSLQDVGRALEAGDQAGAEEAVRDLRHNLESVSRAQVHPPNTVAEPTSSNGPDVSAGDGSGPNLNVRA